MRRFLVTMGVLAVSALAPAVSRGDDQEIAQTIIQRLQSVRDEGKLKGFKVDLEVDHGTVWVRGHVSQRQQLDLVLDVARRVPGVRQVVNDLEVEGSEEVGSSTTSLSERRRSSGAPKLAGDAEPNGSYDLMLGPYWRRQATHLWLIRDFIPSRVGN